MTVLTYSKEAVAEHGERNERKPPTPIGGGHNHHSNDRNAAINQSGEPWMTCSMCWEDGRGGRRGTGVGPLHRPRDSRTHLPWPKYLKQHQEKISPVFTPQTSHRSGKHPSIVQSARASFQIRGKCTYLHETWAFSLSLSGPASTRPVHGGPDGAHVHGPAADDSPWFLPTQNPAASRGRWKAATTPAGSPLMHLALYPKPVSGPPQTGTCPSLPAPSFPT